MRLHRDETLQISGEQWLVSSGLSDGDKLIVKGLQMVRPGGEVRPTMVALAPDGSTRPINTAADASPPPASR